MIGVYKVELNGKSYIGSSSKSIEARWGNHKSQLIKGIHKNQHLQSAFNKYGIESLTFSVLEIVENPDDVIRLEQKYIDELKPEYNIRLIAESNRGCHTKGHPLSDYNRQRLREANIGKPCSEEKKKKIGDANRGKKRTNHYKHTEETKQRLREQRIGKKASEETKAKMSAMRKGHIGVVHTEEAKKKMSDAHIGRVISEETRKRMSLAQLERNRRNREEKENGKTATASS